MMVWYCWSMVLPKWMSLRIASSKNGRTQVIEFQSAVGKPVKAKIVPCCAVWCRLGTVMGDHPWFGTFFGLGESQAMFPNSRKDSCFNWGIFFRSLKFETPFFRLWFFLDDLRAPKKMPGKEESQWMVGCVGTKILQQVIGNSKIFSEFSPWKFGEKIYCP